MLGSGFEVVDCRGQRSSFDVLAKRGETLLLVKVLANLEGLSRQAADELKRVSGILGGSPLVVAEHMKNSKLAEDVVYDRYGVYASNLSTFNKIANDAAPKVYSTRGNYCVRINGCMLADARGRRGLTQGSLAEKLGVSKQSVYRYERSGRMSLEVFERLAGLLETDLLEPEFHLSFDSQVQSTSDSGKLTRLKREACRSFRSIGFRTTLTNAPFDVVARTEESVFSVVSNDWRRLKAKLSVLDEVSGLIGGYTLCVSERRVKSETSVLTPEELSEIKSPRELFKILSN